MIQQQLLKVLVGSHAHGLADEESDKDYRAVYVLPTSDILSLNFKYKGNDWTEGAEDNTAYEIGHFLMLALKCNPTILEVFKAPMMENTEEGVELRSLFPYVWNPSDAYNAFVGYGLNQRKKFLDKKDDRQNKYACAYIRTLINLCELLETGDFSVEIKNSMDNALLRRYKKGEYTVGEVIDRAEALTKHATYLLEKAKSAQDENKINKFLLYIRQKYWNVKGDQ